MKSIKSTWRLFYDFQSIKGESIHDVRQRKAQGVTKWKPDLSSSFQVYETIVCEIL